VSSPSDKESIGRGLGRLPSGLYVLTAGSGDQATGMLASWVQQVGFEPPTVVVALKKGRPIDKLIRDQQSFCIAVLDPQSKALLGHFARGFEPGVPAFDGIDTEVSEVGVPYPTAAAAYLVCRVKGIVDDWADHAVVCGEVVAGGGDLEREPMVHIRKNGFSY
jgi:3-hydroxy-9,10-secoandrosta-1,3,5(10)-triene-9,17-dione monooxygenase reductase component